MNTTLSVNEINLLHSQNEGLKKQNKELQEENIKLVKKFVSLKTILNNFADKFDRISDYEDVLSVRYDDEEGSHYGEDVAIFGDDLDELKALCQEFTDFVEGVE